MPSDLLAEILERIRPEQIIGEYVTLKQAGRSFKGLCPFHSEKTPSFNVSPDNGLWHCFGCGAGGNLIQFLMKIENLPFQEAKAELAKRAGIVLDPAVEEQSKKQNRLRQALEKAAGFYAQTLLKSHAGEEGMRYLETRGVEAKSIEKFQIGMAPPGGHALLRYLENCDFTLQEMQESGLATKSEFPKDYFFKRVIFPIWNASGHLIGFGGRSFTGEERKYINSPESALFKKGENLYALSFAKTPIGKEKFAILAEGYMDVLMLHQHGFEQSVASLGTSLTPQQAKLLSRFTPRVIVSYDGDAAGLEAMRRAMGILQAANLEMQLVALPESEDPDSFLKHNGTEAFQSLLKQARSPVDFIFSSAQAKHDAKSPEGKKKIADEVLPIISDLRDPLLRDEYLKKIAEALDVSESLLRKRLRFPKENEPRIEVGAHSSREEEILKWLLWEPHLAASVWSSVLPEDFQEEEARRGAEALHALWEQGKQSVGEAEDLPDAVTLFLSRLSTQPPVGNIEAVGPLLEAQKNSTRKKDLEALKEEVNKRLKEGKLDPTDEAYTTYLALLKKMKTREEGT